LPTHTRFQILKELAGFRELPEDVIRKIASRDRMAVLRLVDIWRAIEDCLLLSEPQLQNVGEIPAFVWRLWRWCYTNAAYSEESVTTMWKGFCLHVKQRNAHSKVVKPLPQGFPGNHKGDLGKEWFQLLPFLKYAFTTNVKSFQASLMHLCTSRNLPSPSLSKTRIVKEQDLYRQRLTRVIEIRPVLVAGVERAAEMAAHFVEAGKVPSFAHLSLSATACYERPRNQGGRAISVCEGFLEAYVKKPQDLTVEGRTWFGSPFKTIKGVPKFYTMCRDKVLNTGLRKGPNPVDFLESNFETPFYTPFDPEYKIEEPMFGLDSQTGYQILQFCIEEGIRTGVLMGPEFYIQGSSLTIGKPPTVRAEPIGEPGNKVRFITVAPQWLTICLQVLGHELAPLLMKHPALVGGFSRSWKGYDLAQTMANRRCTLDPDWVFVSGDYEVATDNFSHAYCAAATHSFLNASGRNLPFLHLLVDLLCSSRIVEMRSPDGYISRFRSTNGILMGDPGTREVLALGWLVSYEVSLMIYSYGNLSNSEGRPRVKYEWDQSESAGDDFVLLGPSEFVETFYGVNSMLGNKLNRSKLIESKRVIYYCEEVLMLEGRDPFNQFKLIYQLPYESYSHVDALKIRLFSPFGKVSNAPDEPVTTPVIGKGQALQRKADWLPPEWISYKRFIYNRFHFRMCRYLDYRQPLWFIPEVFGGGGIPPPGDIVEQDLDEIIKRPGYVRMCLRVLDGTASGWERRLLQALSRGGEIRGLELDMREQAKEQYVMSAIIAGKGKALDGLLQEEFKEFDPLTIRNMPRSKKRNLAKSKGYIPEYDLTLYIEKAWVLKESFQIAHGAKKVVLARRVPFDEGFQKFDDALGVIPREVKIDTLSPITGLEFKTLLKAFRRELRPKQGEERFILTEIISSSVDALKVPVPAKPFDLGHVRGSVADVF